MRGENITVEGRKLKMSELEEQAQEEIDPDYNVRTMVHNLRDIEVVGREQPPGPDKYVISERLDDVINGEVDAVKSQDIGALIDHVNESDADDSASAVADGGPTARTVVANALGVAPDAVETYLKRGDQIAKLNDAVKAIEDSDSVTKKDSYGRIRFVNAAYEYYLTRLALEL
jgi:hypothetical protein